MEEKRKNNLPKIFLIILAVIIATSILAVAISSSMSSDPLDQISIAALKSGSAYKESDLYTAAYGLYNKGSVSISWNLQKLTEQLTDYGVDIAFDAKIYMNQKDRASLMNVAASVAGDSLVDAFVYLDPGKVLASCSELLGDGTYGVDLTNFKENFNNSVFGENGAYSLGITQEDITEYFTEIEEYKESSELNEEFRKDTAKIAKDVWSMLKKSLKEQADISKKNGSVDFADQTVKTTDIVITLEGEALAAVIEDVLVYLKDSEDIAAFLEKFQDQISADYGTDEDIFEEYRSGLEEALENIDEVYEEAEGTSLSVVAAISKSTKELVAVSADFSNGDDVVKINAICGPTWKNITELNVKVETDEIFEVSYLVKQNTETAFATEFKIISNEEVLSSSAITWDRESGNIEVTANTSSDDEFTLKYKGSMKFDGSMRTITLNSVEVGGQAIEIGDLTVTVNTDDEMPSVGEYKDVLTMSEDEIETMINKIAQAIDDISNKLISALQ